MATIQGLTKDGMLAIAAEIGTKVSKSGDTMTGALVLPADPTTAMQAATKQYVDNVAINTANLVDIDYIKFDPTYAGGSTQVGMLSWDQDNETLEFMLDDHVTLQIGQEHVMRVKNSSGSIAIPERTVVMFAGANGDTITVAPAVSNGTVNVNYLAGITTEEIPADGFGFVTQLGFINQVNTNSWPVGTILYVDPTVAGGLTSVEPEIPAWTMPVASVTKQNASAGRLLVRAIPGGSGAGGSGVVISDTKPAGGTKGDMWYDSNDGTLYVYYEDANSSQWVQIQANSALDSSVLQRLGQLEASNIAAGSTSPNFILNGAFDFWQRGTSFTTTGYGADRWYLPISNATVSQETSDLPTGFQYGIKYVTTATGFAQFNQTLERTHVIPLRGKTVTFSGYVKISGAFSGNWATQALYSNTSDSYSSTTTLISGSSKNVATSATSSWIRFSNTFVVPTDAVGLRIENLPDVQSSTGATVRMTGMQLEIGTTATAFRRNGSNIENELRACKRYYQTSYTSSAAGPTPLSVVDGGLKAAAVKFEVEMRSTPTFSYTSSASVAQNGLSSKQWWGYSFSTGERYIDSWTASSEL